MTEVATTVDTAAVAKTDPAQPPANGVDDELVGRLVEQARAAGRRLTGDGWLLVTDDGEVTDPGIARCPQEFMAEFHTFIARVLTPAPSTR